MNVLAGTLRQPLLALSFASFQQDAPQVGQFWSSKKGPVKATHESGHMLCVIGSIPVYAAIRSSTALYSRHSLELGSRARLVHVDRMIHLYASCDVCSRARYVAMLCRMPGLSISRGAVGRLCRRVSIWTDMLVMGSSKDVFRRISMNFMVI